ncbi:uncharacterized protein RHIMIDRAFT_240627 [Rhizopus microsporus ATCC 52813]|uniref:Uncharacterized protein n=1 Tax=Rhizopus microsporus ATCC 52813 TaxID=1340429 RepID=A0A2G4SL67_RHIZD|nr:uncharacterized protein RHIMIDRAFT_240627 [Rhizopus microsporus ATCC 52813]PHZ09504.1 hypothetical protein RHIMIDRAFT_240627 [Rhizopus microsporus ATCC 52813]
MSCGSKLGFQAVKLTVEEQKKKTADILDYDIACGMLEKIEDSLFQCISFTHGILYYDIEVQNGYLYRCSCYDEQSKIVKRL